MNNPTHLRQRFLAGPAGQHWRSLRTLHALDHRLAVVVRWPVAIRLQAGARHAPGVSSHTRLQIRRDKPTGVASRCSSTSVCESDSKLSFDGSDGGDEGGEKYIACRFSRLSAVSIDSRQSTGS